MQSLITSKSLSNSRLMTIGVLVLVVCGSIFFLFDSLKASFSPMKISYEVHVDGLNYGQFVDVTSHITDSEGIQELVLSRDFVAEKPLSSWAEKNLNQRSDDCPVTFILKNKGDQKHVSVDGCIPLSWSLEKNPDAPGGFRETVKIAVQNFKYSRK